MIQLTRRYQLLPCGDAPILSVSITSFFGNFSLSYGQRRTIYSLRHTYATFRLQEGVNHFVLARNMGTSVKMLEQFYGHVSNRAMAGELTKSRVKEKQKLPWE